MGLEGRSNRSDGLAILVEVEKMGAVAVPLRRTTDGALAPDWGRVPARVYAAGLAGAGQRTMTACLEAIADWLSGGAADIDTPAFDAPFRLR